MYQKPLPSIPACTTKLRSSCHKHQAKWQMCHHGDSSPSPHEVSVINTRVTSLKVKALAWIIRQSEAERQLSEPSIG